jgi:hypothetical protein
MSSSPASAPHLLSNSKQKRPTATATNDKAKDKNEDKDEDEDEDEADIGMKIINQCNNNQDWGKHQTQTNIDEQNIQELQIARILFPAI